MVIRALELVPMPGRIARLPRNPVGYPIPWFVADLDDGTRDFRIASGDKQVRAVREKLCWVCGDRVGQYVSFTIGPMCAVNRVSGEPPAHRDCAEYSAKVCPFLANPSMKRRPVGERADTIPAAGEMIERNPGVTLVWTTRSFRPFRPTMGHDGLLFELGEPTHVGWWCGARAATRAEVLASIDAGLPALREACQKDADPQDSLRYLQTQVDLAMQFVPEPVP